MIISAETCFINDTSIGDLPLIITISDTFKNQPKRLDSDNTINLSSLIVSLGTDHSGVKKDHDWVVEQIVDLFHTTH